MAKIQYARVNDHKDIELPSHLVKELGLAPGDEIRIEPNGRGLYLRPSIHTLKRVYVEVTNKCNLNCSTCMRNVWDVEYGHMSMNVFERILSGIDGCPEKSELFLGGYGEPLSHPRVLEMIRYAKGWGHQVSLITNGILLSEEIAQSLREFIYAFTGPGCRAGGQANGTHATGRHSTANSEGLRRCPKGSESN